MDIAAVEAKVKEVVVKQLKVSAEKVVPSAEFVKDLGADSFASIELVAAFEVAFDIEMEEESALSVKTVGDAIRFIKEACDKQGK
ncbi:MAG: acyl carrier protein [Candidatus Firestonebacteria bacterium]